MRFEDRACLVTGATGGIGQAICRTLADQGARLGIHFASQAETAETLADELPGKGHLPLQADLTAPDAPRRLIQQAAEGLGQVDVLVNNAGVYTEHPPDGVRFERWKATWERTLALNLQAPADLCFWTARHMAERGGGAIVNISSRGAFRGEPTAPAYGASKAGLNALTQSLAQALAPHGITVAAVAPGFVETPMVDELLEGPQGEAIREQSPMERVAQPEEVAACVAFLASGDAEFTTGAILDVNGASYLRT